MGQKVHPYVLRIGFGKDWLSRWFSSKKSEYADFLEEDLKIRDLVKSNYPMGSIATIVVERVSIGVIRIRVRTSRPGVIIGRRGQDIERVKKEVNNLTKKEVIIDVEEVGEAALEAQLVAEQIAFQLIRRVHFRRAMKKAIQQAKKPEPDKRTVLERLNEAKALIEGVAAVAGLVAALAKAAELVQQFF